MSRILLSLSLASVIYGCNAAGKEKYPLLETDYALADTMHYDHAIIDALRATVSGKIDRLKPTLPEGYNTRKLEDALQFNYEVTADNGNDYETLRTILKERGYLLFKSEESFGSGSDKYAVLRTSDQFDIVQFRATNGQNYDISNDSVLKKLHTWYKQQPFEITGAGPDWLEIRLDKLNTTSALAFAKEVHDFCPDPAEEGTETVENLAAEMLETKRLLLWWD